MGVICLRVFPMRFKQKILGFLLCNACLITANAASAIVAKESTVQAAFIYNFALFTEWPALSSSRFNICVMAGDSVYEALQSFKSKQVHGLQVEIIQVTADAALSDCQILFIGNEEHSLIKNLPKKIGLNPVLVVAEENSFDQHNVTITLVPQDGRVAFNINRTSAQASALNISSKLLKLAKQVY